MTIKAAAGCLPVYINKDGKMMFLFGLESQCESSAKGRSDFAGGMDFSDADTVNIPFISRSNDTSI